MIYIIYNIVLFYCFTFEDLDEGPYNSLYRGQIQKLLQCRREPYP